MTRARIPLALIVLALGSAAACQCISGENVPVASLTRRVLDGNGKGISDAEIIVFDAARKVLFKTKSDAHGKFSIPRLSSDEYKWPKGQDFHVEIHATGYIHYHYRLLRTANSQKVQPLKLFPASASLCNDMKLEEDPAP